MSLEQNSTRERLSKQLRRRRVAAMRCAPMPDGRRDPLEPEEDPILTRAQLDDWAMTLLHLQRTGERGLPPANVARALAADPQRYADVLPRLYVA